jgi:hypothetical protein
MSWRAATWIFLIAALNSADLALAAPAKRAVPNKDMITVVVPPFFSEPAQLGVSVMTILQLQLWRTLRKAAPHSTTQSSFGDAEVLWGDDPLDEPTHEAATHEAQSLPEQPEQMVLWGKAYALGSGSSVLSYLTVPAFEDKRRHKFEYWKLTFSIADKDYEVTADLPTRQYAFEPIFLQGDLVSRYASMDALAIYQTRSGKKKLGLASAASELYAEQWEEDAVRVRTERLRGWLQLPQLLSGSSDVIDFVGGLIRVFRSDWDGAVTLLARVVANKQAPTALRVDANLLIARASYELGRDFEPYLLDAEKLNGFAQRVVRYRVMGMLAGLKNAAADATATKAAAARDYLESRAHVFPADDAWLSDCRQLLNALAPR